MRLSPPSCFLAALLLIAAPLARAAAAEGEIVFASYNLENYLRMDRHGRGEKGADMPKPEEEIAALIGVIKGINPDVLGVCEMGAPAEFEDFKTRLKNAGLDFRDSEYVQGADPARHLALLSRLPISSRQSLPDVPYEIDGRQEKVRRGFLDVTVNAGEGGEVRFVGAHLKSKLNDTSAGEALVRRNEAHLLRQHVDEILAKNPDAKLLVYGDFNDSKNQPTIQEIMGPKNSAAHLADLWLRDALGDHWTHYWKIADEYSRIDYIFCSRALLPDIAMQKSRIDRSEHWNDASDHRAIVATIRLRKTDAPPAR